MNDLSYTVEVYKDDKRSKTGKRLVLTKDHEGLTLATLKHLYETTWFKKDGYDHVYNETYVTRKNLLTGAEFKERFDTPRCCSPSTESYWSN